MLAPIALPDISIHAPREGGDLGLEQGTGVEPVISIHAPREGGDVNAERFVSFYQQFQSTPPARGATSKSGYGLHISQIFQSTPPARGATPLGGRLREGTKISIHAPREGGDPHPFTHGGLYEYFNPRPPRGGRQNSL